MAIRGVDYQIFRKHPPVEDSIYDVSPSLAAGNGIPQEWICRTKDLNADVETDNYFSDMVNEFNYLDRIDLRSPNGPYRLYVVGSFPGRLPVTIIRVIPDTEPPDPDPIAAKTVLANSTDSSAIATACPLDPSLYFTEDGKLAADTSDAPIAAKTVVANSTDVSAVPTGCELDPTLYFTVDGKLAATVPAPQDLEWTTVTDATNVPLEVNKAYYFEGEFDGTATLPVSAVKGQKVVIFNQLNVPGTPVSATLLEILQNSGQFIINSNHSTTVGASGKLKSVSQGTGFELLCIEDNVKWVLSAISFPFFTSEVTTGFTTFDFV